MKAIAALLAALVLGGCANFKAVSDFAGATTTMTGTLRTEMQQMHALCEQVAELHAAVAADDTDQRVEECQLSDKALAELRKQTLDVLDLYARTLLAMAEDRNFDLGTSIESTSKKLGALQVAQGSAAAKAQAGALGKVLALLADAVVQTRREDGIRQLVAAGPDLITTAQGLRAFFAGPDGAGPSDYQRLVRLVGDPAVSVGMALRNQAIANNEPIRAAEHRRTLRKLDKLAEPRRAAGAGGIGARMVAAIDAWIAAVPAFQREALETDPKALRERLKSLREKLVDARVAVEAAF